MKILHIAECAGGVERYLQMLIPLLGEKPNVDQILVCSNNFKPKNFEGMPVSIRLVDMKQSFSPSMVMGTVKALRRILKAEEPDVIYCHSSFAGTLGRIAAIGLRCKMVYNPHGWSFNAQNISEKKRYVYASIERLLNPLTDNFVAISEYEKRQALRYNITKCNKIKVIFSGLETEKYAMRIKPVKSALGIPDDSCVIGMVGRISEGKSPDIFVKMAKILSKKIPNAFFVIVGEGELHHEIEQLVAELHLTDKFLITGWVDNAIDYELCFDIAVLLTKWEGFGLAVAEYMLCRKPLVSTRVGGVPDIVTDGYNGLLIGEINEFKAADAVMTLYNNNDMAKTLSNNGYTYAMKTLDIHNTADKHYELFCLLTNTKSGGVILKPLVVALNCEERRAA